MPAYAEKISKITSATDLTGKDIAQVVGTDQKTVRRWSKQETVPRGDQRKRLLDLATVVDEASLILKPDAIGAWLLQPNPLLNFERPLELVATGDYRRVLDALAALGEGVFA